MTAYRLLFNDLLVRRGWRFPVLVLWTSLVGLSEGASIVLLLPLLNRVGIVANSSQSAVNTLLERALTFIGVDSTVKILVFVIVVATVQMVLSVALNWWSVQLARSYQWQRQLELFGAFMRAKWSFLIDRKAGEMVNAIVTECERLGRALTLSLSLFGSAIVAFIYVVLSAFIAWEVTLGLIGFAIAIALTMTRSIRRPLPLAKASLRSIRNCNRRSTSKLRALNLLRQVLALIVWWHRSSPLCVGWAKPMHLPPPCQEWFAASSNMLLLSVSSSFWSWPAK